jgi:hypothetical protein
MQCLLMHSSLCSECLLRNAACSSSQKHKSNGQPTQRPSSTSGIAERLYRGALIQHTKFQPRDSEFPEWQISIQYMYGLWGHESNNQIADTQRPLCCQLMQQPTAVLGVPCVTPLDHILWPNPKFGVDGPFSNSAGTRLSDPITTSHKFDNFKDLHGPPASSSQKRGSSQIYMAAVRNAAAVRYTWPASEQRGG